MLNRAIAILIIVIGLYGCATGGSRNLSGQVVTDVLPTFQKGELRLTCDTACSGAWGATRKQAKSLYQRQLWTDLALVVADVGFRTDLSYFYLGSAAEGLGYDDAARTYFSLATANSYKCNGLINNCDGLDVPRLAQSKIDARNQRDAKEIADRKAREAADRQAREAADRQAREAADRQAREAADRQAREAADRQAREAADRKAREAADRKASSRTKSASEASATQMPEKTSPRNVENLPRQETDSPAVDSLSKDSVVNKSEEPRKPSPPKVRSTTDL